MFMIHVFCLPLQSHKAIDELITEVSGLCLLSYNIIQFLWTLVYQNSIDQVNY